MRKGSITRELGSLFPWLTAWPALWKCLLIPSSIWMVREEFPCIWPHHPQGINRIISTLDQQKEKRKRKKKNLLIQEHICCRNYSLLRGRLWKSSLISSLSHTEISKELRPLSSWSTSRKKQKMKDGLVDHVNNFSIIDHVGRRKKRECGSMIESFNDYFSFNFSILSMHYEREQKTNA